ncbi:MAG: dihydroorotate dehydrogenase electron transfer subunit [Actinomycetes bacterium]
MSDSRPIAPFGRRSVSIVETRSLGLYQVIKVQDDAAPLVRPGQFHMLSATVGWGGETGGRPWLGRAISFLSTDGSGGIEFLVDGVGPGTHRLSSLKSGDQLDLVGPLGNGFPEVGSSAETKPCLVAGGIGLAPILALSQRLELDGVEHDLILGFRNAEFADAARDWPNASVSTDDGSVGEQGTVIAPLTRALDAGPRTVYACGPPLMLEAVRALCDETRTPAWFAMEAPMACGFGACFGCAVETKDGIVRLCVDGPVLSGSVLAGISSTGRVDAQ